jgi:hypothetical protein
MIPRKPLLRNRSLLRAGSKYRTLKLPARSGELRDSAARRRSKMHPHLFILHVSSSAGQDDLKSLTNIGIGYFELSGSTSRFTEIYLSIDDIIED